MSKINNNELHAIVTDGLWRKSLSAVRSLGKRNYRVTVMGDSFFTTGFWSRYAGEFLIAPTAAENASEFGARLLQYLRSRIGTSGVKPVLLPMEDATLLWASSRKTELESLCHLLLPSAESIAIAESKYRTMALASELGLPVPKTLFADTPVRLQSILSEVKADSARQYIVKPVQGSGSAGIKYDPYDATIDWAAHWQEYGPSVVQERLPAEGRGIGVSVLMDRHGECRAWFIHERLQQYPNSGGPSTDRQSLHHPELLDFSLQLLRHLNWQGVAMVEWKVDTRTQRPMLMEINPRFWGSLELAIRAGVDFPYLYAQAAAGETLPQPPDYSAGVRCRWLIPGDLLRYLTQDKSQRESLRQFLRGLPAMAEEWDSSDLKGTVSALICPAINVLKPKYWKFLTR